MQITSLLLAVLPLIAGAAAAESGFEKRADQRQVYNFSKSSHHYKDAAAFCHSYKCECINFDPKGDLTFKYSVCQPGDRQGKNTKTEARAFCTFTDAKGKTVVVNKHVSVSPVSPTHAALADILPPEQLANATNSVIV